MPEYLVLSTRYYFLSEELRVTADSSEEAMEKVRNTLPDPIPVMQLEHDLSLFETHDIQLLGKFGLEFYAGTEYAMRTSPDFTTQREAMEVAQDVLTKGFLTPELRAVRCGGLYTLPYRLTHAAVFTPEQEELCWVTRKGHLFTDPATSVWTCVQETLEIGSAA